MTRERLDKALVARGLAQSRERARALILAGRVDVDGRRVDKVGAPVGADAKIEVRGEELPFVSRGGVKLEHALETFGIDVRGRVAVDLGASTGGFTDCLLQRGAARVHAIDVGYNQLAWKLRSDPRVVVRERQNVRALDVATIDDREKVDLVVGDLSFISLTLVLPTVRELLAARGGDAVLLVKPQFEVGKGKVGKGGVVREEDERRRAREQVAEAARAAGFEVRGETESPIRGAKSGNVEYLLWLRCGAD